MYGLARAVFDNPPRARLIQPETGADHADPELQDDECAERKDEHPLALFDLPGRGNCHGSFLNRRGAHTASPQLRNAQKSSRLSAPAIMAKNAKSVPPFHANDGNAAKIV